MRAEVTENILDVLEIKIGCIGSLYAESVCPSSASFLIGVEILPLDISSIGSVVFSENTSAFPRFFRFVDGPESSFLRSKSSFIILFHSSFSSAVSKYLCNEENIFSKGPQVLLALFLKA
jgi:hypothetical protein